VQSWESRSLHAISKAINPEGKPCLLKRYHAVAAADADSKTKAHKQFQTSMAAVRLLNHDTIVRPRGYFKDNNDYILEIPHCGGGTLKHWLSRGARSLMERYNVAVRLVAALKYMHVKGERSALLVCPSSVLVELGCEGW
jgi:hypothetical protein